MDRIELVLEHVETGGKGEIEQRGVFETTYSPLGIRQILVEFRPGVVAPDLPITEEPVEIKRGTPGVPSRRSDRRGMPDVTSQPAFDPCLPDNDVVL